MSTENENVPYEQHIIPSQTGGAQGLSGFFDMAGEITKDVVGLTKEIGSDIAELGQEIGNMMGADLAGEEQFPNQEWADQEFAKLLERRSLMREQDHDIGR
jgi:hypothetical protein